MTQPQRERLEKRPNLRCNVEGPCPWPVGDCAMDRLRVARRWLDERGWIVVLGCLLFLAATSSWGCS